MPDRENRNKQGSNATTGGKENIDGFSDNVQGQKQDTNQIPNPADPGIEGHAPEPLSPDQYERAKEEARGEYHGAPQHRADEE